MDRLAIIYGVTGQDGSYLSDFLLTKGYRVIGVIRRTSTPNTARIEHLINEKNFSLIEGDVTDSGSVFSIIGKHCPDEVYNLSAQSHVGTSFKEPLHTFHVDALGELNILEAIRQTYPKARHYFAGTSEQFGNNYTQIGDRKFQDEDTPFAPASPYAAAKVAAHHLVKVYRESYKLHASVGILFNHESPRRGDSFVTKKITNWINAFSQWLADNGHDNTDDDIVLSGDFIISNQTESTFPKLRLGNINASRDWGYAGDYIRAMYLMLQQEKPDDYVIATGETHTVREFLSEAFKYVNVDDFESFIVYDESFTRPNDVHYLCGRPTKAMLKLGWFCEVSFQELVELMIKGSLNEETSSYKKEALFEVSKE